MNQPPRHTGRTIPLDATEKFYFYFIFIKPRHERPRNILIAALKSHSTVPSCLYSRVFPLSLFLYPLAASRENFATPLPFCNLLILPGEQRKLSSQEEASRGRCVCFNVKHDGRTSGEASGTKLRCSGSSFHSKLKQKSVKSRKTTRTSSRTHDDDGWRRMCSRYAEDVGNSFDSGFFFFFLLLSRFLGEARLSFAELRNKIFK